MLNKITISLAGAFLVGQVAHAHHAPNQIDIVNLAEQSKLVFHGKVIEIAYHGSQATKHQESLPHTFVTYQVDEVLHGNMPRKTFTLRFMGGVGHEGKAMLSTAIPQFSVGDEDVLFVSGNGVSECPLVDCSSGRFRIVEGHAYNALGQKIVMDEHGALAAGTTDGHDLLNSFVLGDKVITMRKGENSSEDHDGKESQSIDKDKRKHLDANSFIDTAVEHISRAVPDDPRGLRKKAMNVDKDQPFSAAGARPVSLPDPAKPEQPSKGNANDQFELDAAELQDGNPVLD